MKHIRRKSLIMLIIFTMILNVGFSTSGVFAEEIGEGELIPVEVDDSIDDTTDAPIDDTIDSTIDDPGTNVLDISENTDTEKNEMDVTEEDVNEPSNDEQSAEGQAEPSNDEQSAEGQAELPTEIVEELELEEIAEDGPYIDTPNIPVPFSSMRAMQASNGLSDTIAVNKTAKRNLGCRTFEVILDITGTPQKAPVDVVLIIDRSGSMGFAANSYTRLYYAKQAAINFAGRVLGPNGAPGSRVAVVSFSGPTSTSGYGDQNQASIDLNLSSDLTTVTNEINAISAVGGTNTEAGFKQGQSVIQGATSNQKPNSNKVVIMLTDGLPTASNKNKYADTTDINHVHIQRAIAAGKNIYQNNIADVFTIGLTTGMNATDKALADNILTQAQNKGYYPAPSATDLDTVFNQISQSLGYAATNASVVDKIGDNFELVLSSLPSGATYDSTTREITWTPGTIVSNTQLKYIVQAKSNFAGGLAYTNESATLTYKDIFGVSGQTKDFPIPNVEVPTKIEVSLTDAAIIKGTSISLGIGTDPSGENYMSPVTGGDNDGIEFTYEWRKVGDDTDTVISIDKNPEVNPTENTQYEVAITDSNGCIAIATMWVRVEKPISNPEKGSITIIKTFSDNTPPEGIGFTLTGPNNYTATDNTNAEGVVVFQDLEIGKYFLEERLENTDYINNIASLKSLEINSTNLNITRRVVNTLKSTTPPAIEVPDPEPTTPPAIEVPDKPDKPKRPKPKPELPPVVEPEPELPPVIIEPEPELPPIIETPIIPPVVEVPKPVKPSATLPKTGSGMDTSLLGAGLLAIGALLRKFIK